MEMGRGNTFLCLSVFVKCIYIYVLVVIKQINSSRTERQIQKFCHSMIKIWAIIMTYFNAVSFDSVEGIDWH